MMSKTLIIGEYLLQLEYGTLPKTHQQGGQLVFKLGQTRQEKSPLEDGGIHLVF